MDKKLHCSYTNWGHFCKVNRSLLSKKTGGHVTSAFGTPRQKLGLGIVQNWG